MIKPLGYNPIRWRCEAQGCFNIKCRPKVEVFADCFPGRINFSDLDYIVERCGYFLWLEWKHPGAGLARGQARAFEAFTKHEGNVVFVVWGDEETMITQGYVYFWKGRASTLRAISLSNVKMLMSRWVDLVEAPARQQCLAQRRAA